MKNKILLILMCFTFYNVSIAQQITVNFTVDNIFSAYVGNRNAVTVNKVPATQKDGGQIFTATSLTSNYNQGDWAYVIAWSDDATCQGMIGEIKYGNSSILTGDPRWEVYPTGIDFDRGQSPSMSVINKQITIANNSSGWRTPSIGETNANTTKVCRAYPRPVTGISNNARWVWNNSNNASSPFYPGFDHNEFLIFRVPMDEVITKPPVTYDPCCPPISKGDVASLFNPVFIGSINGPYRMNFNNDANFRRRMQAYTDLLSLTCGSKKLNATIQLCDMGTGSQPGSGYCNTKLKAEYLSFVSGGQGNIQNLTAFFKNQLQPNHWYRITVGIYPDKGKNCFDKKCSDTLVVDFNFQTSKSRTRGGTPNLTIKGLKSRSITTKSKKRK